MNTVIALKHAFRQIAKGPQIAVLHFLGLSLGIGVCFLIALWIRDELAYDRFHSRSERIGRALWQARFGDNEWKIAACPVPLAPLLASQFPEIERATQVSRVGMSFKKGPEFVREPLGLQVDEHFGAIFDLDFIAGNPNSAFQNPDAIVLNESMARRYFGTANALGQTMIRNDGKTLQITGVVRDWPTQSHLKFDFLSDIRNHPQLEPRKNDWTSATVLTYFLLKKEGDFAAAEAKMADYCTKNLMEGDFGQGDNFTRFPFQKGTDIHLHSDFEANAAHGDIRYVWIFSLIALCMLGLACINFINLATARALVRAREVGVRKVLGSTRRQLIGQFMAESFTFVLGSVMLAMLWATLALPAFKHLTDKDLNIDLLYSPEALGILTALTLLTTLVAGAFPAYFLSAFSPAHAIRSKLAIRGASRSRLRQALVVAQFSISTALIIGALVVRRQMDFLQNQSLGFHKSQVLVLKRAQGLAAQYSNFFRQVRSISSVEAATAGQFLPGKEYDSTIFVPEQPSNYQETSLSYSWVDGQFASALGLQLKSGKDFTPGVSSDSAGCLINETCARRLGWTAENAVGRKLLMGGNGEGKVLGVLADFHFQSLHHAVEPLVLKLAPWPQSNAAIRLRTGSNLPEQITQIQALWKSLAPNVPFEYSFLDEDFDRQYAAEARLSQVFSLFSALGMVIACLGLFGLASFMAIRRTKEIGIRKVLGASVPSVTGLLAKDFLKLVLIALVIASPIAWYGMQRWLADFAYRIELEWWMFAAAGAAAVLIAFLTVGFQSVKAALADPVKSLRSE